MCVCVCVCVWRGDNREESVAPQHSEPLRMTELNPRSLRGDKVKGYLTILSNDAEEVPIHKTVMELHDGGMVQL